MRLLWFRWVLLSLAFGALPGTAQENTLSGRVVDQRSGAAVAGATVAIAGLPGTTRTDANGVFVWNPAPPAPFDVIIILPGGQVAQPITIERVGGATIDLPVNPLADESLTVVGAAPSVSVAPAAGTTLLSSRQITRRSPEHLLQALETVPGVNQVSEGHAAVPAIRGLARGRTLLLIDGARVSSERRVGPSATTADPASFEGIDVARGPGSVAYGSDALGGVISVRTRRAEPGSPLRVRGTTTFGAGIPERRGSVEIAKGLTRGGVLLQAHAREAEDWSSPEGGTVFNSGWRDRGVLARFDHQAGRGVVSAVVQSDFGRDIERPRNNSDAVRFYYPHEDSHRLSSSYEVAHVAGLQQLAITGFIGTVDHRTDQDRSGTATEGRSIERSDVSARDFHVKGSGTRRGGPARVEFGVDVNGRYGLEARDVQITYDLAGNTTEAASLSIDSARRTDVGAYVQADAAPSPAFRSSAGLRIDRVTTANAGGFYGYRSTSNAAVSGFGSATAVPFRGFSLTGQVSRGFRDPTLSDRYYRGPSGRGFITGNPALAPERTLQFDLAARYTGGGRHLGVYLYHYRVANLIERFSPDIDFFFFRNQGRARLQGIEVEARMDDVGGGFAVELGASLARGTALDGGAPLDDISPRTLSLLVRRDFGERVFAHLRGALMAEDLRPGPSEVAMPGATILDLAAGVRLAKHLELRGGVRNLLNDRYYASPDVRWVYAPGRSASVTLAVGR